MTKKNLEEKDSLINQAINDSEEHVYMTYNQKTVDYYNNPQNVGAFKKEEEYVGTGLSGAPACGDVMQLQIQVDPQTNKIQKAKFKTFGCVSAIASSAYVTEMIEGMSIEDAAMIENKKIAQDLSLPPIKLHCSVLAEDVIKKAIADYKQKHITTG